MHDIIRKYSKRPFRYGADCCQFVGECLEARHGYNPMQAFSYKNKREANKIISSYGTLADAVTAVLGAPVDEGKEGDVVLFTQANGTQVTGILYRGRIIARTPSGLMDFPPDWAQHFWRVDG